MNRNDQQWAISEGMDAVGSDGDKVGEIVEVNPDHFVVQKGFFFPNDYYIPTSAVASVDENKVHLNVTKEEALNQDPSWEQQPAMATTGSTATAGYSSGTDSRSGAMDSDPAPFEHEQDSSRNHVNENDNLRVDVAEEELTATTRGVDRGSVNVQKNVVTEEQQLDVPVTEERVNVQRRTVDRDVAAGDDAFSEGTIDVPVYGEEVDVQKRARVTEEIEIDKEAVQGTQRVTDTVRREEVTVDESGTGISNPGDNDEGLLDKAKNAAQGGKQSRKSRGR